jgi:hypothetical protein
MKYKINFLYEDGTSKTVEADRYRFQSSGVLLEKKRRYEGKVLRTDEEFVPFLFVNLETVLVFEIKEEE